jgi:hypothetical protein
LVVGIILNADWSAAILDWLCLVVTGTGQPFWILILENIILLRVLVGFDKGFFSAGQEKCCVLLRNYNFFNIHLELAFY